MEELINNVPMMTRNKIEEKAEFTKKEKITVICFATSVFLINYFPPIAFLVRYAFIPVLLILLLKYDSFELLLFPLLFLDDTIGTLIAGRITYIWIYFVLIFLRTIYKKTRYKAKLSINTLALLSILMSIYFASAGLEQRIMVYIKVLLSVIILVLNWKDSAINKNYMMRFQFMIISSTLVTAISMVFGIGGQILMHQRDVGFGFSDPNFAASICCVGLSASLYIKNKNNKQAAMIVLLGIVYLFAILKTASLTGILIAIAIILSKIGFVRGLNRKVKSIFLTVVIVLLGVMVLIPWLGDEYFHSIITRINTIREQAYLSANYLTSGRSSIFEYYFSYYTNQSFFAMLFGGNILNSERLLSKIGQFASHNTYIDHLLVFGLIGSNIMLYVYIKRIKAYYLRHKSNHDNYSLMMVTIKLSLFAFAFSLSYLETPLWWYLALI